MMCWCYYDGDRGRCGYCRAHHCPLHHPLSTPTDFHGRSPIQTFKNIISLTTLLLSLPRCTSSHWTFSDQLNLLNSPER